jgi:3-hydroxy acid dehydrogenase/malonic semialdehyde reductase
VQAGGKIATIQLDVSDKTQVAALWDKVPADLRTVDILGTFSRSPARLC